MPKSTKEEQLKSDLQNSEATVERQLETIQEATSTISALEGEIVALNGLNNRQNGVIEKLTRNIQTLKDVCHYYRSQRDRVDAYLSAVLDQQKRHDNNRGSRDDGLIATAVGNPLNQQVPERFADYAGRPNIREPHVTDPTETGRAYAGYRDREPDPREWENL